MSSEVYNNGKDKLIFQDVIKITEENSEVYDRAERITRTSYVNCTNDDNFEGYIEVENVESMIEDLCDYIKELEEDIKNMEQDLEDNYIRKPWSEYTGDSYDDRF